MSSDDFLFTREFKGGWLVTRETLSQDKPSDPQIAYERAMGPDSLSTDGFFNDVDQADDFVESVYDCSDATGQPFEYGSSYSTDPYKF